MTASVYQLDAPDAPATPSNNSSVLPDGFEWVEEPSGSTRYYGSTLVEVKITGVIKNTSGSTKSYVHIRFNLYDSNGYQIGQAIDTIRVLSVGSSWKFNAVPTTVLESVARFEFASLTVE